jgi:pSer/pThr/pTyr-binding forkhead associated (FHA) protein
MASLRLKFPEKSEPTTIVLSGSRVTVGRLPLNTIQILDRTLSGFHAEFVLEEDHYRLHDRGSTNGTYVNGDAVTDFHLRETCRISFGGLECDYNAEAAAPVENGPVEALPTRSEINAVRQENADLKSRVEALRDELDALHHQQNTAAADNGKTVPQADYDRLAAELERLKTAEQALQQEVATLKGDLTVLQRERESLRQVTDSARAEIASLQTDPAKDAGEPFKLESSTAATPPAPAKVLPKPGFSLPTPIRVAPKTPGSLPAAPTRLPAAASALPKAAGEPAKSPVLPQAPGLRPFPRPATPVAKGGTQKIDAAAATPKPLSPTLKPFAKVPVVPDEKKSGG